MKKRHEGKVSCSVAECQRVAVARGYCGAHYQRIGDCGSDEPERPIRPNARGMGLQEKIDAFVDRSGGMLACWPWTLSTKSGGYGRIMDGKRALLAHRVAFEVANGPIPDGLFVCHLCDNRICCNPAHLWLGTAADNNHDRDIKGRAARQTGENNGRARISAADAIRIREMRRAGLLHHEIAGRFGISISQSIRVVRGQNWRMVPGTMAGVPV